MRHARPGGAVLLEVIVALAVLTIAGVSAVAMANQAAQAVAHTRQREDDVRRASAFLGAVALWPREDLDRHLGDHREGAAAYRRSADPDPVPGHPEHRTGQCAWRVCASRVAPDGAVSPGAARMRRERRDIRSSRVRRAFTLLEVVVALAVTGLILLGGRLLLEGVGRIALSTTRAAEASDRALNGDEVLRSLAGRLEIGTGGTHKFGGDERSVHFTTWCNTPQGWLERCDATIAVEEQDNTPALVAHLTPLGVNADIGIRHIVLARGFHQGGLRYLMTRALAAAGSCNGARRSPRRSPSG